MDLSKRGRYGREKWCESTVIIIYGDCCERIGGRKLGKGGDTMLLSLEVYCLSDRAYISGVRNRKI